MVPHQCSMRFLGDFKEMLKRFLRVFHHISWRRLLRKAGDHGGAVLEALVLGASFELCV